MWLANGSQTQNESEPHTPQRGGLLSSIGSRLLRAVPWSSPRRGLLPTHDEPTPPKRAKIEAPPTYTPERASERSARTSFEVPRSTLPTPQYTPDRQALFARAATPSALRTRAQLTPVRARGARGVDTLPASHSMSGLSSSRSAWSTLHLGPTQTPSLSTQPSVREWLPKRTEAPEPVRPSAPEPPASLTTSDSSVLGKRSPPRPDANADATDAPAEQPSARKRRIVWDPAMGFVDADELERSRPRPPPPQNEAERILRALESMRTPLGDARREGIVRSQSMPSWQTTSISVPLPAPTQRTGTLSASQSRSPGRSIAPHSRSLQRSQQLRRTQIAQQPNMRSKLRHSVRVDEAFDPLHDEEEVEHAILGGAPSDAESGADEGAMREEELVAPEPEPEVPVRRSARRAAKAAKPTSPRKPTSKPRDVPTIEEPEAEVPVPPTPAAARADACAPKIEELPTADQAPAPPARKDTFSVRTDDEPDRKRSVLRQGAPKKNRRHAPSGRITAFDDDEEDDLPQSEELEKIKLPTGLFPSHFTFGEGKSDTKPSAAPAPAPPAEQPCDARL